MAAFRGFTRRTEPPPKTVRAVFDQLAAAASLTRYRISSALFAVSGDQARPSVLGSARRTTAHVSSRGQFASRVPFAVVTMTRTGDPMRNVVALPARPSPPAETFSILKLYISPPYSMRARPSSRVRADARR